MYNVYINDDKFGNGLSSGELNQALLDLDKELPKHHREVFRRDLGWTGGKFEKFLYEKGIVIPMYAVHKGDIIAIEESQET